MDRLPITGGSISRKHSHIKIKTFVCGMMNIWGGSDEILSVFQDQQFYKKREKTVIQQSMRKEKLRKVGICFI